MANTRIQVKRSSVSGRTPNVSNPSNTSYIAPGEFALNMADGLLYTSNGTGAIIVGAAQKDITANSVATTTATIADYIKVGEGPVGGANTLTYVSNTLVFVGNGTYNTSINTSSISVSNTLSNVNISPRTIFVGNSAGSVEIDVTGGTSNLTISKVGIEPSGYCTIQTTTDHNIVLDPLTTVLIADSPTNSINNINYNLFQNGFKVISLPSANQIQFALPLGNYKGTSGAERGIKSISRANGVATCVTGAHGFTGGERVFIRTTTKKGISSFETNDSTITYINTTAFSYTNQSPDATLSLVGKTFSVGSIAQASSGDILLTINYANHGLIAGQKITIIGTSPSFLYLSGKYYYFAGTTGSGATWVVHSINGTTSFTIKLGVKLAKTTAIVSYPFTFTAGTIKTSFNETITLAGAYDIVGQYIPAGTTATGNVVVSNPVGISIGYGNNVIKITDTVIYVGNTVTGYAITSTKAGRI